MNQQLQEKLRQIPAIDTIIKSNEISELCQDRPHWSVVEIIRNIIDDTRKKIIDDPQQDININDIYQKIRQEILLTSHFNLRRVINATGVILHTNLGRSLLSESAQHRLITVANHYSTLEFNLHEGKRGNRHSHVSEILCELTGAEAAMVVNNNASATFLMLYALTRDREVIVSRGQLVEIGGSFRMPDVMTASGAKMVEIGTTNKTHLRDYKNAITPNTGAILLVRQSNFAMVGFTAMPGIKELAELGSKEGVQVLEDLGCGALIDLSKYHLHKEPTPQESIAAGVDVVCFSGDKLLGGPQAGILVGKKDCIDVLQKHPLARAIRVDKFTIAALEATLQHYKNETEAIEKIPTLKMLLMSKEDIQQRTINIEKQFKPSHHLKIEIIDGESEVGGGTMPLQKLPTTLIALKSNRMSANEIEQCLRLRQNPPVLTRIQKEQVVCDLRTIQPEEEMEFVQSINQLS